jgi:DNA-3-methyladenine glycosylase
MFAPSSEVESTATRLLDRAFFNRPTDEVARGLLGVWLLRSGADGLSGGPIVEVEAYGGPEDLASHARAGRTRRTTPMFGPVGNAYVYLVYGMHECLNVVAFAEPTEAGAVLIRAIEPAVGVDLMRARRGRQEDPDARLCAGPARLCQALGVNRTFDGHDLTVGEGLWLAAPMATLGADVSVGIRIGVDYAADGWAGRQSRYWVTGNQSVSRIR